MSKIVYQLLPIGFCFCDLDGQLLKLLLKLHELICVGSERGLLRSGGSLGSGAFCSHQLDLPLLDLLLLGSDAEAELFRLLLMVPF